MHAQSARTAQLNRPAVYKTLFLGGLGLLAAVVLVKPVTGTLLVVATLFAIRPRRVWVP